MSLPIRLIVTSPQMAYLERIRDRDGVTISEVVRRLIDDHREAARLREIAAGAGSAR